VGGEGLKERMKKGEYGECILYSYAKTEQWNLLKLFYEGEKGDEEERWRGMQAHT
jgi:hypothetical protein